MGHTRTSADVCNTTASPPEADMTGSPSDVAEGPKAGIASGCFLRQRRRYFAGGVDEKLRNRAQRAILQGNDSGWKAGRWQLNGQDGEFGSLGGKPQCGM